MPHQPAGPDYKFQTKEVRFHGASSPRGCTLGKRMRATAPTDAVGSTIDGGQEAKKEIRGTKHASLKLLLNPSN
jgi:hypothetical protein